MNPWLVVVLIALTTYRLTRLIVDDRISKPVVDRVQEWAERRWIAKRPDSDTNSDQWQSSVAYLFSCPWCVSVYVAGAVTVVVDAWFEPVALPVLVAVVASGVTGLLATAEHAMSGD